MSIEDQVRAVLSDTLGLPPEFLDYTRQYAAMNPTSMAKVPGDRIALGQRSASVATAGTTFGTGVDLLAAGLTLSATGQNSYLCRVSSPGWQVSTAGATIELRLNLNGADAGRMALYAATPTANLNIPLSATTIYLPSAGTYTVNVRLLTSAGTATVNGGTGGGGGTLTPIIVMIEVA